MGTEIPDLVMSVLSDEAMSLRVRRESADEKGYWTMELYVGTVKILSASSGLADIALMLLEESLISFLKQQLKFKEECK